MNIRKCDKGHPDYDADITPECPICRQIRLNSISADVFQFDGIDYRQYQDTRIYSYGNGANSIPPNMANMSSSKSFSDGNASNGEKRERTGKERHLNGLRSVWDWFKYSVFACGIPLILYLCISCIVGASEDKGLTELAAFFFGVTVPTLFDHRARVKYYSKAAYEDISWILIAFIAVFLVVYCVVYMADYCEFENDLTQGRILAICIGACGFVLSVVVQ